MVRERPGITDPARTFAEGPLPAVLLLCGPESFLVDRAIAALRKRVGADADPSRAHTVWGDDAPERIAGAIEDLATPGLFGTLALLVIRRAEALKGPAEERVAAWLGDPSAPGHVALAAQALDRRRRLFQAVPKNATHEYPVPADRGAILAWVGTLAAERGLRVSGDAAAELADRCGADLGRIAGELDKLAALGKSAGVEEVRHLVAATRAHGIEELSDAIARGDRALAVRRLRALLAEGEAPLRIVAFLAANLRRALHVAELAEAGCTEAEIAARVRLPPWLVRKQRGRARAAWLIGALGELAALDRALKRSRAPDAVVEATIVSLTMPRERAGAQRG